MTTFDGWDTHLYGNCLDDGQDSLAHFRTKGSKNGVRRYQQPDGTWTPLGLRERRIREGWGDREQRRAEKKAARAERKAAKQAAYEKRKSDKAERIAAREAAKKAVKDERERRIAEAKEAQRKKNIKNLTDDEMKALLNRVKMEQEYKELTRSPLLKVGEKLVGTLIEASARRREAEVEANKQRFEILKATEQTKQKRLETKKAEYEAKKATEDRKKMQSDVEGGLKIKRKAELRKEKTQYKRFKADNTIIGGIKKRINALSTAGLSDELKERRTAYGKAFAVRKLAKANAYDSIKKSRAERKNRRRDNKALIKEQKRRNTYNLEKYPWEPSL